MHGVVNMMNSKGSSRRDSYSSHFLIVVMFIVQSSVVDKPVDKTSIISTVLSTRGVLETLVDKPVDKKPIFSTVSSTRVLHVILIRNKEHVCSLDATN